MDFLPKSNQKIDLKVLFGNHAGNYSSYVEEVSDKGIMLAAPTKAGYPIPLATGGAVRLEYVATGAKIAFNTRITAIDNRNIPVIKVAIPDRSEVERQQLRTFVRQDATLNLTYKVFSVPPSQDPESPNPPIRMDLTHRSRTKDISAGGAQILCTEAYPKGTILDMTMDLNGQMFRTNSTVVRVFPPNDDKTFWTAVQFVGLSERDQDIVIRFIFNLQREMRRKGLM